MLKLNIKNYTADATLHSTVITDKQ